MRQVAKFNEGDVNQFLLSLIEKLSDYSYVQHLKNQRDLTPSDSIDVIVLFDEYANTIEHLYSALNNRMSNSDKIPTFFRSQDQRSFMFPCGVNCHFIDDWKKFNALKHRWNIIAAVHEFKFNELFKDLEYELVVVSDAFYNQEKEYIDFWSQDLHKRKQYGD